MNGIVKTLNEDKGFGFILGEDGNEYFFHKSAVEQGYSFDRIVKRMAVTFEPTDSPKGPRAEDVAPA